MNTVNIRTFTRNQGYRGHKEPVVLVAGKEVLGTFYPAGWEKDQLERQRAAMGAIGSIAGGMDVLDPFRLQRPKETR